MKRSFLPAILAALAWLTVPTASAVSLPFHDAFNYSEGRLNDVSGGNWIAGSSGAEISVSNSATLTAPAGLEAASGKGVRRAPSGTARRSVLSFGPVAATDGVELYLSCLVNVQTPPAGVQTLIHLDNSSASVTSPDLGLFLDNGPKAGVGKNLSSPGFTMATNLGAGTHLLVARYTFQAGNDKADLWVDPPASFYGAGTAPTPLGTHTNSGDPATIGYCQIVSPGSAGGLQYLDELRIGSTWAEVVPGAGNPWGEKLGFTTQPANAAPGATMSPVVVQVQNALGVSIASNGVPITLALTAGSGTLSGTLTKTSDATGKAVFDDLSISTAGADKQLTAAASGIGAGLASGVSATFAIEVPVTATQLAFTTQPSDTPVAAIMTPAVVVQVQDSNRIAVNSNNVPVTLTLSAGTGVIGGTTTRNTDATGKATFNDLTFSTAGTGKQLTASASGIGAGLAGAVSAAFAVTPASGGGSNLFITASEMLPSGFKVRGTNSTPGVFTQILGATRPDEPAANWLIVNYQNADANGQVAFTNPVSPALPLAFYCLRTGDTTTKLQPPSISLQPESQIVSPGATATFSVAATGPQLQYLWFFNGAPVPGATAASLAVANAQTANAGNYQVAVANPAGNLYSAVATLGVSNVAPTITLHPQNQTNNAGGTAIFSVAATGTAPLAYQWYYNTSTLLDGKTNAQLLLTDITTNDAGAYRCIVANNFGSAPSADAHLTVNPVPTDLPATNIVGWAAYAGVTGGAGGTEMTVSDYASLRAAVRLAGPLIIRVQGAIVANEDYCYVEKTDKTIVGVGTDAALYGAGFRVGGTNIIIANMFFNATNHSDADGVTIDNSSHGTGRKVWVDHCTFYDCRDGSVDVTKGADYVTVSWCKFSYAPIPDGLVSHEYVNLIASSDSDNPGDAKYHVTFHHNWYGAYCRERMPSVRFGRVHVFNNYYDCLGNNYCVRTRKNAEVLVENNYFLGVQNPWERFVTDGSPGLLKAAGNITNNCTFVDGWTSGAVVIPGTDTLGSELNPPPYSYTLTPASDVPYYVQTYAGSGKYPYAP